MPGIATKLSYRGTGDLKWSLSPELDISFCSFCLCSFQLISRGGEKYAKNWTPSRRALGRRPVVLAVVQQSARASIFTSEEENGGGCERHKVKRGS